MFDLWYAVEKSIAEPDVLVACFRRYLKESGHVVSRAQFESNLHAKRSDPSFRAEVQPLLRSDIDWDFDVAMDTVLETIISLVPGEPWKAPESS